MEKDEWMMMNDEMKSCSNIYLEQCRHGLMLIAFELGSLDETSTRKANRWS